MAVIIPARNESRFIGPTLKALNEQTLKPYRVIVVNDGSTDNTHEVAAQHGAEVIDLVDRGFRATGKPALAYVFNKGLEAIADDDCKYVMILGADHVLPAHYVFKLAQLMEDNKRIAIASGIIEGESQREKAPRGSGRIVRYDFWKQIGLQYPTHFGYESYIVYKALANNHEVHVARDLVSWSQRPTGKRTDYRSYGKAMKALGYHPLYAIGRSMLAFTRTPSGSMQMFLGYISSNVEKYDVAHFVHKLQAAELKRKMHKLMRRICL